MGQQPNIELESVDLPIEPLERGVERRWSPRRPGEIESPADVPVGASFGRPGPDAGWALRLLSKTSYDRGSRPDQLADLLTALVGARAAAVGRGPAPQDIEAALSIVGLRSHDMNERSLAHLAARRTAWLDAVAHEPSPGMAALEAVPESLLADSPVRIRARLNAQPNLIG